MYCLIMCALFRQYLAFSFWSRGAGTDVTFNTGPTVRMEKDALMNMLEISGIELWHVATSVPVNKANRARREHYITPKTQLGPQTVRPEAKRK